MLNNFQAFLDGPVDLDYAFGYGARRGPDLPASSRTEMELRPSGAHETEREQDEHTYGYPRSSLAKHSGASTPSHADSLLAYTQQIDMKEASSAGGASGYGSRANTKKNSNVEFVEEPGGAYGGDGRLQEPYLAAKLNMRELGEDDQIGEAGEEWAEEGPLLTNFAPVDYLGSSNAGQAWSKGTGTTTTVANRAGQNFTEDGVSAYLRQSQRSPSSHTSAARNRPNHHQKQDEGHKSIGGNSGKRNLAEPKPSKRSPMASSKRDHDSSARGKKKYLNPKPRDQQEIEILLQDDMSRVSVDTHELNQSSTINVNPAATLGEEAEALLGLLSRQSQEVSVGKSRTRNDKDEESLWAQDAVKPGHHPRTDLDTEARVRDRYPGEEQRPNGEGQSSHRVPHLEASKQGSEEEILNRAQLLRNLLEGDLTSVRSSLIFEDDKTENDNVLQNTQKSTLPNQQNTKQTAEEQQVTAAKERSSSKWSRFYQDQNEWAKKKQQRLEEERVKKQKAEDEIMGPRKRSPVPSPYPQLPGHSSIRDPQGYKNMMHKYLQNKKRNMDQKQKNEQEELRKYTFAPNINTKAPKSSRGREDVVERLLQRGKEYQERLEERREQQDHEYDDQNPLLGNKRQGYLSRVSERYLATAAAHSLENSRANQSAANLASINEAGAAADTGDDDGTEHNVDFLKPSPRTDDSQGLTMRMHKVAHGSAARTKMDPLNRQLQYEQFKKKEEEKEQKIEKLREEVQKEKYRDRPQIDENSKRMGGASAGEKVHERLYQIGQRKRKSIVKPPDYKGNNYQNNEAKGGSQSQRATIDGFLQRNYNDTRNQRERKELKEKARQDAELAKCFKPKILDASKSILESRGSSPEPRKTAMPSFEQLYREAEQMKQRKDRKREQLLKQREAAEMKEVKRGPDINPHSKDLSKKKQAAHDNSDLKAVTRIAEGKQSYGELQKARPKAAQAPGDSYLQNYLQKRNSTFNQLKAQQDKSDDDTQKEIKEMSRALLAQIREQKQDLIEDAPPISNGSGDQTSGQNQFEMIESFLESLAGNSSQQKGAAQEKAELRSPLAKRATANEARTITDSNANTDSKLNSDFTYSLDKTSQIQAQPEPIDRQPATSAPQPPRRQDPQPEFEKPGSSLMSGFSSLSTDAKILNEATQAILDFERFNNGDALAVPTEQLNPDQYGNFTPIEKSNRQRRQSHEEQKKVVIVEQINTNHQEQDNEMEGALSNQKEPLETPKPGNRRDEDLRTAQRPQSLLVKQQMLFRDITASASSQGHGDNTTTNQGGLTSQNSQLEQRYMQFVQTTESKLDYEEQTPDTDLRREHKYSEPRFLEAQQLLGSPEPAAVSLREMEPARRSQDHVDEPSIRSSHEPGSIINFENMVKIESPSPHKHSNFKNLEPEQKSRSTHKAAYSEMAFSGTSVKNKEENERDAAQANPQSFNIALSNIMATHPSVTSDYDSSGQRPRSDYNGSPEIGRGIAPLLEDPMQLRGAMNQPISTTEIQIVENPMDDSGDKREEATKTENEPYLGTDSKPYVGTSAPKPEDVEVPNAQNYESVESGEGDSKEFLNPRQMVEDSSDTQLRNSIEKQAEQEQAAHFNEGNAYQQEDSSEEQPRLNPNAMAEENESQGPVSAGHRANKSLSLIEEAENEDSISYQMSSVLSGQKNDRPEYGQGKDPAAFGSHRFAKGALDYNTMNDGAISQSPSPIHRDSIRSQRTESSAVNPSQNHLQPLGGYHKHSKSLSKEKLQGTAALDAHPIDTGHLASYIDIDQVDAKVGLDGHQPTGHFRSVSSKEPSETDANRLKVDAAGTGQVFSQASFGQVSFGVPQASQPGTLPGTQYNSSTGMAHDGSVTESNHSNHHSSHERASIDVEKDPSCPALAKDIIGMERDFIQFLSQIYSI